MLSFVVAYADVEDSNRRVNADWYTCIALYRRHRIHVVSWAFTRCPRRDPCDNEWSSVAAHGSGVLISQTAITVARENKLVLCLQPRVGCS